ncbi:hypothetical protein BDV93DRAFT_507288 [Ceratobasidium sp. AG-I]|nr:hypothetical protein BDV93DRAFT_507288 [Ceratobasidium sp. AG-I]
MCICGVAHKEARAQIEAWALETSKDVLHLELVQFAKTTKAPGTETDVVSEESLAGLTFDSILEEISAHVSQLPETIVHRMSHVHIILWDNMLSQEMENNMSKWLRVYKYESIASSSGSNVGGFVREYELQVAGQRVKRSKSFHPANNIEYNGITILYASAVRPQDDAGGVGGVEDNLPYAHIYDFVLYVCTYSATLGKLGGFDGGEELGGVQECFD